MTLFYRLVNMFEISKPSSKNFLYRVFRRGIVVISNIYGRIFYNPIISTRKLNFTKREKKLVASLTTFPDRIRYVSYAIETIFAQKYRPDSIELWLSIQQFPNGVKGLPFKLKCQIKRGLKVNFCDDLRSHKKYYYSFQENPNNLVVTVDDDVFYSNNILEKLIESYKKDPLSIHCNIAKKMKIITDKLAKYNEWDHVSSYTRGLDLVPIGVGGVLYDPKFFSEEVYNKTLIKNSIFNADDLWLKYNSLKNQIFINRSTYNFKYLIPILGTIKSSLWKSNVQLNLNDVQLKNIILTYHANEKDFIKKLLNKK